MHERRRLIRRELLGVVVLGADLVPESSITVRWSDHLSDTADELAAPAERPEDLRAHP